MSSSNKYSDVPIRIKSWIYIILVVCVMLVSSTSMNIIVALLSGYSMYEFCRMTGVSSKLFNYLNIILPSSFFFVLELNQYCFFLLCTVIYTIIYLIVVNFSISKKSVNIIVIIAVFIAYLSFGHLSFLRNIEATNTSIIGIKLTFFILLTTELNDVFQYLTGKAFGKRKIVPKISPNKTVEGFIGGIILSSLLATITGLFLLPTHNFLVGTLIGLFTAILGFCGDIFMSYIKRKSNVKDTGTLIPGHGGLLDRMDSLIFVLPYYYWFCILVFF